MHDDRHDGLHDAVARRPPDPSAGPVPHGAPSGRRTGRRRVRTLPVIVTVGGALVAALLVARGAGPDTYPTPVPWPRDEAPATFPSTVDRAMVDRTHHDDRADATGGPSDGHAGDAADSSAGDPGTQGRWGEPAPRPTGPALVVEELRGGWRVGSGVEEAAALAVVAAHGWAVARSAVAPSDGREGADRTMGADGVTATGARTGTVVTVEAVERPGPLHAVVTLLTSHDGLLARVAVPVLMGPAGPTLAGDPWPLPAPTTLPEALSGTPVGDEVLVAAARRALDAIGIDGARMTALEATEGWPFIARLEDDSDGHPWLRWHLDRFVVAGLPLDASGGS